ncbi:unnamed protein product [Prorocentrum cordatum]|uniref:Uncharacterized protein n=1 Tax=Prorocentrum cordatum TaxID=2364126 RepID=A0ABN9XZ13_9DINO|nr:unnamed protein product [Polarella glacialis]
MGLTDAMAMLKQLEETAQAEEVRNPNAFVAAAIRRASAGSGKRAGAAPREGPGRAVIKKHLKGSSTSRDGFLEKIRKRVAWLNANARLNSEITWDKVSGPLVDAGEVSLEMLQELEGSSSTIRDPTGWLIATARKKLRDVQDGAAPGARGGEPARVPKRRREEPEQPQELKFDKLEKRLNWLNEKVRLQSPLRLDTLVPILADLDLKQAFDILKSFEEKADSVRDPTAYVASAARDELRLLQEGGRMPPGPEVDKLEQRLTWLNEKVRMNAPLRLDTLVPILADLDLKQAFEILKSFEEKAESVRDPTAYVASAARDELRKRREGGAAGGLGPEIPAPRPSERAARRPLALPGPPATPPPSSEEARLQKRIAWLNSHAALAEPLVYEELAPDLLGIGYLNALEVLNNLEENGEKVRNPNRYVISGARKVAAGEPPPSAPAVGRSMQPPPPQGPSRRPGPPPRDAQSLPPRRREPPGADGEKLEKRIACGQERVPEGAARLRPARPRAAADDARRRAQDAEGFRGEGVFGDVRDPTAYILGIARRCVAGDGGRGPPARDARGRPSRGERPAGRGRAGSAGAGPGGPIGAIGAGPPSRGAPALKNLEASPSQRDGGLTYYGAQKRQRDDPGGPGSDAGDLDVGAKDLPHQLRARIESLNAGGQLQLPLEFEGNVRDLLMKVEASKAMSVLNRLGDIAREVRDPTGFVVATVGRMCKRTRRGS